MASSRAQGLPGPVRFVLDVATRRNEYAKFIPPLLWLGDALLTCLVIWKVPCKLWPTQPATLI